MTEAPQKQALEGSRTNVFLVDPKTVTIVRDPKHPLYDERIHLPIEEGLVLNIMEFGVKDPVRVSKDGAEVLVVDGRRRTAHLIEANKRLKKAGLEEHKLPVMVDRGDMSRLVGIMISLNENRKNDIILAKADKVVRYLDMGRTEQDAAVCFGVEVSTIKNWVALASLDVEVKKAVSTGKLSPTAAWQLATLSRDEQRAALQGLIEAAADGKAPTVEETTEEVRTRRKAKANGGTEPAAERVVRPGKSLIKKVVVLAKGDAENPLGEASALDVLRWVIGDLPAERIKGLKALIKTATEKKAKAAAAAEEATASEGA